MSQNESSSFGQEFEELSSQEGNSPTQKNPLIFPEVNKSTSDQDRRAALKETLETLSSLRPDDALDKLSIDSVIKFFIALYCDYNNKHYHHMYSDVCEVMYGFFASGMELDNGVPPGAKELANNLEIIEISMRADKNCPETAKLCVAKLHDHVELENTRMQYLAKQNSINADKANELNGQLKNVEEKMNNTQEKLQRNYVTILGIFAAIVFTFAAGTSFTSSVLETMASVSIYRLILMVALLAFVLFNSIYALFLFICRVSKFNEGKHLPKIICITDFVLLICIISTFFAWDGQFLTH